MKEEIELTTEDKKIFEKIKRDVIDEIKQREIDNINKYWDEFENNHLKKAIVTFRKLNGFDNEIIYELIKFFSIIIDMNMVQHDSI